MMSITEMKRSWFTHSGSTYKTQHIFKIYSFKGKPDPLEAENKQHCQYTRQTSLYFAPKEMLDCVTQKW